MNELYLLLHLVQCGSSGFRMFLKVTVQSPHSVLIIPTATYYPHFINGHDISVGNINALVQAIQYNSIK